MQTIYGVIQAFAGTAPSVLSQGGTVAGLALTLNWVSEGEFEVMWLPFKFGAIPAASVTEFWAGQVPQPVNGWGSTADKASLRGTGIDGIRVATQDDHGNFSNRCFTFIAIGT